MEANVTSNTVLLNYTNSLNLTVAVFLLVIGVFGVICNAVIVYVFYKEKTERNSFNLICVFRSISNIYILLSTFLGLFLPTTVLGFSPYSPAAECWIIHISNTLYLGNEYQIMLVAVNRFTAMFFPFKYQKIFKLGTTLVVLLAIYITRIGVVIFETISQIENKCYTYFSVEFLAWIYNPEPKCMREDNILTFIATTFILSTIVNVSTLSRIIVFYKIYYDNVQRTSFATQKTVFDSVNFKTSHTKNYAYRNVRNA
uniref:G_PROTEIN_RECEP_F1_2 domain-containing protein n=1 Tax=Caenorhabditis japonica TaxID=281687 RepID=A0A8R1HJT6_CAEJA